MSLNTSIKFSLSFKLFIIGFLTVLLMIPTGMIALIVNERENRREEAVREVSEKWSYAQTVSGPVLTLPYRQIAEITVDGRKETQETVQYAHFLPETLAIDGVLDPETRQRGIYEVVVYKARLNITGRFQSPDLERLGLKRDLVLWDQAFVSLSVSDMRGIQEDLKISWNGQAQAMAPGVQENGSFLAGASALVKMAAADAVEAYDYKLELSLRGSQDLKFSPLGRTTTVNLSSAWPSPSFQGAFLPQDYELKADGFTAQWKVLELNRNFPQSWLGSISDNLGAYQPNYNENNLKMAAMDLARENAFGARLLIPADEYQQANRTLKYAILVLALTFLVLFFYETLLGRLVHPLQYILIGLALALFYVLLISIAEHLGFDSAYLISALATIGLIKLYAKSVFGAWKPAISVSLILTFIYGFIYIILQMEDYSLLAGAIGLFAILSIVMYVSRRIDWYKRT